MMAEQSTYTVARKAEGRRRIDGGRVRRQWAIVEDIAAHPGWSRRELADKYFMSERQVQADLIDIRDRMRLPLVRGQGYRFADEGVGSGPRSLRLRDALTLVTLLARERRLRTLDPDDVASLATNLPELFPPHLRPLAARLLRPASADSTLVALAGAVLDRRAVKLDYPEGCGTRRTSEPIVVPELLVPFVDTWICVGACNGSPSEVFWLDGIFAVTLAAGVSS